ncbi:MAG: hypothetical protein ACPL5F_13975, partial [Moorellaceae bacterium]
LLYRAGRLPACPSCPHFLPGPAGALRQRLSLCGRQGFKPGERRRQAPGLKCLEAGNGERVNFLPGSLPEP